LLKALREENDLITSLTTLGLSPKQAYELISDSVIGQAQTEEDPADGTVDASDQLEDGNAIIWWNDIEKDSR
jgi:UDP-glucose:glycoprotein glucosyltransferase